MSKTVAEMMVEVLHDAGASRCYGIPGDTLNFFTDALRRSPIRWIHVRHEEVGAFAAGADAMLTGELALCAGSCGPGSLHFINGLWESNRNHAPVVLIASQIVRDELGFEFPQEVDFKSVYASGTVFCEEIRTPSQARRMTVLAAQAALSRKGVAVLVVPVDVSRAEAPEEPPFSVHRASPLVVPSAAELMRIADVVNAGKKIAIYGGSGCQFAAEQVIALGAHLKAPIARTSRAKDFLEANNPLDVGMTGIFGAEGGYRALAECDTLILLGCDFAWRQFYPSKAKIVQIDLDGVHLGRRHPIDVGAVGDIGITIEALLPLLERREDTIFLDLCRTHNAHALKELEERAVPGTQGVIHPQYLTEVIAQHATKGAIYTADGGSPMVWCLRHIPSTGENRTVVSLSHGTMASAMPQALGAQAAFPGRQVIAMSGDGGLSMLLGDLLTAVQEKLPIKIVVFNNGSLGFVEIEQKVEGLLDTYTDLTNPDFSQVAMAMGLWGRRVTDPADVPTAVAQWLAQPGPALLDAVVLRNELVMPAKVEASQVFGMALYAAKGLLAGGAHAKGVISLVEGALRT
jgi:pyruvate dehydrogenase (quinone)